MSAVKGGGKVRAAGAAWPGKRAPLPVARALRILAAAIAPATEPRCPLAHRGPKPPASARPAHGRRFAPAGSGAGLSWRLDRPIYRAPYRAGGGNAVRFLFPPGDMNALSPLLWQGPSPLPQRCAGIRTSRGPKPPASARPARRALLAGRAGAGLRCSRTCRSTGHRRARAGKRGSRFLVPSGGAKALSPLPWQGPSPLPKRCAGIRTSRGPKPPASARPAHGGRFPPAGSGAGLCWCGLHRSWWQRSARAGKRGAFPVPARTNESTLTASMAGAIAPATALHWHQDQPGAKAPGQRPTCPRPAPDPPPAGASRPPGRALASAGPGPAGPQGTVPRGRGKRGSRFLVPPGGAIPFPGSGRVSRQAGGRIALSAPWRSPPGRGVRATPAASARRPPSDRSAAPPRSS